MDEQAPDSRDSSATSGAPPTGRVMIAPVVLAQIIERTALGVPGVAAMCARHPRFDRLRGEATGGVRLTVVDNTVSADIAIVTDADARVLELGRRIQHDVSEALQKMVGMDAGEINVYVGDVRGRAARRESASGPDA